MLGCGAAAGHGRPSFAPFMPMSVPPSVMGARHTQGRSAKLTAERPCPAAAPWGKSRLNGYARWEKLAGRQAKAQRTRESMGSLVDWRTTSDDATLRKTFSPGLSAFGSRPSIRYLSTLTDRRATASSPGAIDVSAGDRYCESSELSKPTTEMSSGMRRPRI